MEIVDGQVVNETEVREDVGRELPAYTIYIYKIVKEQNNKDHNKWTSESKINKQYLPAF